MTYCTPTPIPSTLPVIECNRYNSHFEIIGECLKFFGISNKMLVNKCRQRSVLWPRQMIINVLLEHTSLTVEKIGEIIQRDHSTISTSRQAVNKRLESNIEFKEEYNSLIQYLRF